MLWVYDHYKYLTLSARGRTLDVEIKKVPVLKMLTTVIFLFQNYYWSEVFYNKKKKILTVFMHLTSFKIKYHSQTFSSLGSQ